MLSYPAVIYMYDPPLLEPDSPEFKHTSSPPLLRRGEEGEQVGRAGRELRLRPVSPFPPHRPHPSPPSLPASLLSLFCSISTTSPVPPPPLSLARFSCRAAALRAAGPHCDHTEEEEEKAADRRGGQPSQSGGH